MTCRLLVPAILLFTVTYSANISFIDSTWRQQPVSLTMDHILNLFRHQIGQASTTDIEISSHYIKQLSYKTIHDKIIVYLMNSLSNIDVQSIPITNYVSSPIASKIWKSIASYAESHSQINPLSKFTIVDGANLTLEDIHNSHTPQTSKVIIWGQPGEHQKIKTHFTQSKRLLQQTTTNSSYLIKFFFSVLFIVITFAILFAIAGMQNQRDTLLYAKFVADVGVR